jgi:hypothetical protein
MQQFDFVLRNRSYNKSPLNRDKFVYMVKVKIFMNKIIDHSLSKISSEEIETNGHKWHSDVVEDIIISV